MAFLFASNLNGMSSYAVSTAENQLNGEQKTQITGAAKGSTLPGEATTTDINADTQALDVNIVGATGGVIPVIIEQSTVATHYNIPSSAVSVVLLAANPDRIGAIIRNDSAQRLYIRLLATSTTDAPIRLNSQDYYEIPYGYNGVISGIWNVANGFARVEELE